MFPYSQCCMHFWFRCTLNAQTLEAVFFVRRRIKIDFRKSISTTILTDEIVWMRSVEIFLCNK